MRRSDFNTIVYKRSQQTPNRRQEPQKTSADIEREIAEFLAKGGQIVQVTARSEDRDYRTEDKRRAAESGARARASKPTSRWHGQAGDRKNSLAWNDGAGASKT